MNYYEFLNKKLSSTYGSSNYGTASNPFANQQVSLNGTPIFAFAKKEDFAKIDYDKVLQSDTNDKNTQLSGLEFVLRAFFSIDEVKKAADTDGKDGVSKEEAQAYLEKLALKDGDGNTLSLADFDAVIKEEKINLENLLNSTTLALNSEQDNSQSVQQAPTSVPAQNYETPQQYDDGVYSGDLSLSELKQERSKLVSEMRSKKSALAKANKGNTEAVKQAKSQADAARKNYEEIVKTDETSKQYVKQIIDNNKNIERNQKELDKVTKDIAQKESDISAKESAVTSASNVLSGLKESLSSLPSPTGKPEDKEKDKQINARRAALTKEIAAKEKDLAAKKAELQNAKKELSDLKTKKLNFEVEKENLQKEKMKLDEWVNKNCSDKVKTALEAYNKSLENLEKVKKQEIEKAQKEYDRARLAVEEIDSKIAEAKAYAKIDRRSGVGRVSEGTSSGSSSSEIYTGNPSGSAKRAVELALSHVGVREIGASNDSTEIRKYKNGAINNQPWCASFVSWLYGSGQESSNSKTFGYTASSQEIKRKAINAGCYAKKNSGYTPMVGDLAMWTKGKGTGHVGIVVAVYADGSFDTVEGNSSNAVSKRHYKSQSTVGNGFDGFVQMSKWLG